MQTSSNSLFIIMFLAIVGIAFFAWYKKRKEKRNNNPLLSTRKNKDEVWKIIKQFLKDNNERGKKIIDSFVVKRDYVNNISPNGSYQYKINKNFEIKIRNWQIKYYNKLLPQNEKPQSPKVRDLFVVIFTTEDEKTKKIDRPRCFECEVINKKIAKNKFDRKIIINKILDYDSEMEWIAPIKDAENAKKMAMEKTIAKQKAKQQKKLLKQNERKRKKILKNANKK